jgi:hypothetical protein
MDYLMCGLYFIGGGLVTAAIIFGMAVALSLPFAFLDYVIHILDGCKDVLEANPFEEKVTI